MVRARFACVRYLHLGATGTFGGISSDISRLTGLQYVDFELVEPNSVLATLRRLGRVIDFCRVFSAHDCGIGGSIPSTVSALGLLRSALLP